MALISPIDATAFLAESKQHPFHIGLLQVFTPPEGAAPSFARDVYESFRTSPQVAAEFRRRPKTVLNGRVSVYTWVAPDDVEIDRHLHYAMLPAPGTDRDFFEFVARRHTPMLDRSRALWEVYVIDGLEGGRFAVYTKVHHALIDGVTGLKLAQNWLSEDPGDDGVRTPWAPRPALAHQAPPRQTLRGRALHFAYSIGRLRRAVAFARQGLRDKNLLVPFRAPRTMFNVPSGGAMCFGARSWQLSRLKAVANEYGVTVNEVVLAMIGGALRTYLKDQDALPDDSLVAMVPVNVRTEDDVDAGNIVGVSLCDLGTNLDDPALRVQSIHNTMQCGKKLMRHLPKSLATLSALLMVLPTLVSELPIIGRFIPPLFNVALSNVPGMRLQRYLNGARVDANIPITGVFRGQTLNLALTNGANTIDLGVIGTARALPAFERLLDDLEAALRDLEQSVALTA